MSSAARSDAWEIRAARNQALFRAINDELTARRAQMPTTLTIACECADTSCVETIDIDAERYAEIRADATHFAVLVGHVYPEVERVVAEGAHHVVVEKIGEAARVAVVSD